MLFGAERGSPGEREESREPGAMVKTRRHHWSASVCSSSPCRASSPSPATSLSLVSNPPHLKPPSEACTPFISSLKRCPLLADVNAEFSGLAIEEGKGTGRWGEKAALQQGGGGDQVGDGRGSPAPAGCCGRSKLQQHWIQVGGKVIIPDTWGLEKHLQEWVSYGLVEDALRPAELMSARSALVADCTALRRPRASAASSSSTVPSVTSSRQQLDPPQLLMTSADAVQVSSCC